MSHIKYSIIFFLFLNLISIKFTHAVVQKSLQLPDGSSFQIDVYGEGNLERILWIAPSYGLQARHQLTAMQLADIGFEVWQLDLAEALFLTHGANSLRNIPPNVVASLIKQLSKPNHKITLITSSYGSIPTLRGVQHWQSTKPEEPHVAGVILFSPILYTHVPPIGQAPNFVSVETSIPIYIFQGEKNGNRWHFPAMRTHIQRNATVYSEIMEGVTSLFYDKDTTTRTLNMLEAIPGKIKQRIKLLSKHPYVLLAPSVTINQSLSPGLNAQLEKYSGTTKPYPFSLKDVSGKIFNRADFTGKVTIINFWASWCPPCVEEIPSLNRLRAKMQGKNIELISINYAESAHQIKTFMDQVAVDFPVLIDPEGQTAGKWNVVAFPSTFVIGPDGEIYYGVNAAIHWDTAEVINQLQKLLQ